MKTIENYLSRSSKMMVCWEIRSGRPSKPNLLGMSCQADSKPFRLMFKFSVRNPNYAFMCTCIHTLYQLRYMTYMYIYIYMKYIHDLLIVYIYRYTDIHIWKYTFLLYFLQGTMDLRCRLITNCSRTVFGQFSGTSQGEAQAFRHVRHSEGLVEGVLHPGEVEFKVGFIWILHGICTWIRYD